MTNFYTQGRYHDGKTGYFEKHDTLEDAQKDAREIKEAEEEFNKMGSPANLANGVVQYSGLQIIIEFDE